eukprot:7952255-Alexandrium_andersonii.AAC.1
MRELGGSGPGGRILRRLPIATSGFRRSSALSHRAVLVSGASLGLQLDASVTRSRPRFRELQPSPRGGKSRGVDARGVSFDPGMLDGKGLGCGSGLGLRRIATP